MIVANIKDSSMTYYKKAHPRFEAAFALLEKLVAENAEVGKYEADGKNLYAMVQEYETRPIAEKKFEIHKDYIDIQYIVKGAELMGSESLDKLTPMDDYKPDVQKFFVNDEYDSVVLCDGEFAIFFPDEPHAPGAAANGQPAPVRKIVVKVLA